MPRTRERRNLKHVLCHLGRRRYFDRFAVRCPRLEYQAASIYWHATGYGCDHERKPGKLGHFGMSIVEAMSAGAVPLVYDGGGPREIIASGVNGFLWSDLNQLAAHKRRLVDNPALREVMAARAVAASRRFGVPEFLDRMDSIIARPKAASRQDAAPPEPS